MAKFLNTSATNYFLEALIKSASERLRLINPFLTLNDRIKELLEDKHYLTDSGKQAGGAFRMSKRFGPYFLWPASLSMG